MNQKLQVLFLCTGNSCRSQMAEGFAKHLKADIIDAYSAGIETHGLNPNAVKVMAEVGVDISNYRSKRIDEFKNAAFDLVITVCEHAHELCPIIPGKHKIIQASFDDPPRMAKELAEKGASAEEQMQCYRNIRDEIKAFVEKLPSISI